MSIEQSNNYQETTWSSNTPHDIVHRQQIIDAEGEFSQRVLDMEAYISYINTLPDEYRIITGLSWEDLFGPSSNDKLPPGFVIYKPDNEGTYKQYATIVSDSQFIGDKIIFDGNNVVVVNTEHAIGVSPLIAVKIFNADETEEYSTAKYINRGFETLLEVMGTIEKGEHKIDLDIQMEL